MKKWVESLSRWSYGLAAAIIGGGASSVVTGVAINAVDPVDFNLAAGLRQTLAVMGVSFVLHGLLNAAMFLKQSPLPRWDGSTERRNGNGAGG